MVDKGTIVVLKALLPALPVWMGGCYDERGEKRSQSEP